MPRINFWSWSLSRFELDQRSREARLRFERLERLLLRHATQPHCRALAAGLCQHRNFSWRAANWVSGGPVSDQRPSRIPTVLKVQPGEGCTLEPERGTNRLVRSTVRKFACAAVNQCCLISAPRLRPDERVQRHAGNPIAPQPWVLSRPHSTKSRSWPR